MKFRAFSQLIREFLDDAEYDPKVAISVDGDEVTLEVRFVWRRSAAMAGVNDGLAVVSLRDLREAMTRIGDDGAMEIESVGGDLWVRSGPTELGMDCIYERDRP